MNKTKIILVSIGAVTLIGALALGYLIFDESTVKSEKIEELESAVSRRDGLKRGKPYPSKESKAAVEANRDAFKKWYDEARSRVERDDLVFDVGQPASFKADMVADARRLAERPGSAEGGKLVKKDFPFGFGQYITGGELPPATDLKRLAREWNDVSFALGIIADLGASEIDEVTVKAAPPPVDEKNAKKKGANAAAKIDDYDVTRFSVVFHATPAVFAEVMNAFAATNRFIVVDSFAIARGEKDELVAALVADADKDAAAQGGRKATSSRRRSRRNDEEKQEVVEVRKGAVNDPDKAASPKFTLELSVYDFRSLSKPEEKPVEKAKGKAKKEVE